MTIGRLGLVLLPVIAASAGGAAPQSPGFSGHTVSVTITDLRNSDGVVRACMTSREDKFPKCRGVATAYSAVIRPRTNQVVVTFDDVAPGRYAIALLHDENGNGKADRALGMMPKEGFGFSRDAPVRMGPPKFGDAAFDLDRTDKAMQIRMRYMM
ncbi:DUF2141 domain-containing protein [Erythrobacter litoralis]|uniref:DUF2141 domain-containing protein n=1 Tax=Erythrobacter litoralis TaxID=39960 RepID=UPI002434BDDE|nr:DUF2141 domain-containing protein [Erythrobacter litoralis]MDG6079388.1 DUF2141 domain-containing protein [Erythrobacter litoralis]